MYGHRKIKTLLSILLAFILISYGHVVMAGTLLVNNSQVSPNEAISITAGDLSGDRDWVGIYHKNDSNDWVNMLSWDWVNNATLTLDGVADAGEYEARLFFHNSFNMEASAAFNIASITASKSSYLLDESINLALVGLSGDRDWVGIYRKGDSNDWGNVLGWDWATNDTLTLQGLSDADEYEARLFYHNSFTLQATASINISAASIVSSKTNYQPNESITVNVTGLTGDQDWVGIYRKGDSNDWANVLSWDWANNDSITLDGVPDTDEYEARLFFHNSFQTETSIVFTISAYDGAGPYLNDVVGDVSHDKYVVYKPIHHLDNAPIVLFIGMTNSQSHIGLMKFIASRGVYVIGNLTNGSKYANYLGDTIYKNAIADALQDHPNLNTSKLGIIGHSQGGGQTLQLMEYFKGNPFNYGGDKSFVISLDGWFSFGMNKEDLENLHTDSLFIQYGGLLGTNTDPRISLSISNLLPNNTKKGFTTINMNDHGYSYGPLNTLLNKDDLLKPIGALIDYTFFNDLDAHDTAFGTYASTINNIIGQLPNNNRIVYTCEGKVGGAEAVIVLNDIDYCSEY